MANGFREPNPSNHGHLQNEPADKRSLFHSLYLSITKALKIKEKEVSSMLQMENAKRKRYERVEDL